MVRRPKTTNIAGAYDGTSKWEDFDTADWLSLSATPIFGIMALLTAVVGTGPQDMHASWLTGMAAMYLLMSVVHSAHWLKLLSDR
jgi:hypothetical protein